MKLKQLLTAIKYRAEQVPDVDITDLVYDSRKAVPGCAFGLPARCECRWP